jgi:magnesium-transporting ATPase (P-type)
MGMVVSFAIRSWIEAGVVTAVVVINIVVGFFQEYSAEKTMDSLRSLSTPTATVVRGGHAVTVRSADIAPGDIVEIKTGDTIPADLRLIEAMSTSHRSTNETHRADILFASRLRSGRGSPHRRIGSRGEEGGCFVLS